MNPYVVPNANPDLVVLAVYRDDEGHYAEEVPIVAWVVDPNAASSAIAKNEIPSAIPVCIDEVGTVMGIYDRASGTVTRPQFCQWETREDAIEDMALEAMQSDRRMRGAESDEMTVEVAP